MLNSQHTCWGNSDVGFMFALYGGPFAPNTLRHNVADHESMPRCPVRKVGPVKWLLWMASNGLPALYGSLWM
jgi:hypothetical protein